MIMSSNPIEVRTFASSYVFRQILKKYEQSQISSAQEKFRSRSVRGPDDGTLFENLFFIPSNIKGKIFKVMNLKDANQSFQIELPELVTLPTNWQQDEVLLQQDLLYYPSYPNLESGDGFCLLNIQEQRILIVLQTTIAESHPIKGRGLENIYDKYSRSGFCIDGVRLIFVTPFHSKLNQAQTILPTYDKKYKYRRRTFQFVIRAQFNENDNKLRPASIDDIVTQLKLNLSKEICHDAVHLGETHVDSIKTMSYSEESTQYKIHFRCDKKKITVEEIGKMKIHPNSGKGNCFFHAVAEGLPKSYRNIADHMVLRTIASEFIGNNISVFLPSLEARFPKSEEAKSLRKLRIVLTKAEELPERSHKKKRKRQENQNTSSTGRRSKKTAKGLEHPEPEDQEEYSDPAEEGEEHFETLVEQRNVLFNNFITNWLQKASTDGTWVDNELVFALANVFNLQFKIIQPNAEESKASITTIHPVDENKIHTIWLLFKDGHYELLTLTKRKTYSA